MKKLFLIPLMAMLCTVMAWGTTRTAGTFQQLQDELSAAQAGDVIQLTADIDYGQLDQGTVINITKSITINGKDDEGNIHTIKGASHRGDNTAQWATIWINKGGTNDVDVTFKDIKIINPQSRSNQGDMAIHTRGHLHSLTLQNAYLETSSVPLQIGGNHTGLAYTSQVTIENSHLKAVKYYALLTWNKINLTATDSKFEGWAGLYFKGVSSSTGSRGTVVNATNCDFECFNKYSGRSNAFGVFVCEDDGITITATNCLINSSAHGDQSQAVLLASGEYMGQNRRTQPISLTLAGDNTRIIMDGYFYSNIDVKAVETFNNNTWYNYDVQGYGPAGYGIVPFSVTMTGGTYDVNPMYYRHVTAVNRDEYGQPIVTEDGYSVQTQSPIIPSGYAVIPVQDGDKTLYRVQTADISYDINGTYEGGDEGENPTTSFIVETTDDQPIELTNDSTVAAYVQVRDNGDGDATVLLVGKVENAGTDTVDQTLVVNNGLDVQGNSQVIVQTGSTLQIGEGGIVTEKPENIVISADENGAASLIMDPAITVNQTPNLTVKMKAKQIGWILYAGSEHYFWHRFALPIQECTTWVKNPNKSTYVFGWNYSTNDWEQLSALTQMQTFKGYTLTADFEDLGDVEYTFTGRLAGNVSNNLQFERNGFNFFGNSYTGYIDILALVDQIMGDNKIDGTVWMWHQGTQSYVGVPLQALRENPNAFDPWMREVAPMQTFILKQNGSENASAELNYASAVWGNPRYGNNNSSTQTAPQRIQNNETARMRIIVKADNGKSDFVMLTEDGRFSDAFEKGYDGEKYMNENTLNMYATVNNVDYTAVATDNLAGKALTLNTVESVNYTMSFAKVNGEAYAIRDLMTNIITPITEGNTYTFAAQPNTTIEGRFVIVPIQNMPTDVETVENTTAVKGIYTITGQYVGEDFDILPAGMYIVNGVKIVK